MSLKDVFTPVLYVRLIELDGTTKSLHGPFEGTVHLSPFLSNLPPDVSYELFSNVSGVGFAYQDELRSYQALALEWKDEAERRPVPSTIEELQVP